MIPFSGVCWRLLAEENGASPDCTIVVVLTDSSHSVYGHTREPSAPNPTCSEFKSGTNLEAWDRATCPKILVVVVVDVSGRVTCWLR